MTDQLPLDDEMEDITLDQVRNVNRAFNAAYGATLAEWSRLEGYLFQWFHHITGMNEKMARAIFFSGKSFNARADMLEAAVDASRINDVTREFLNAAMKRAKGYSSFRNAATHGEPFLNVQRGSPTVNQMVILQGRKMSHEAESTMITMRDLTFALNNFQRFCECLDTPHPRHHKRRSPKERRALLAMYQRQVLALPSQAHSKEPGRTPAKPKPPRRSLPR